MSSTKRWHRWIDRHGRDARNSADRARRFHRAASRKRAFVGVDGEGSGRDDSGRQIYRLLRAGDYVLYNDDARLTTRECLEFILSLPSNAIYVGFAFGYDVTMILRDLDRETLRKLFDDTSYYVYWKDYAIHYRPRQEFRVARVDKNNRIIRGSSRAIYETFGFFQCSFLRALNNFNIGQEYLELIERNKSARGEFTTMRGEVMEYNHLECKLLAELMEKFRDVCFETGIVPKTWNGAGKIASSLHRKYKTTKRNAIDVPQDLLDMANDAYYGGRFEVTRIGDIAGPIYAYDIRSAYPASMLSLPCLEHGKWVATDVPQSGTLYISEVQFQHPNECMVCGLPFRTKSRRLHWPRSGRGAYWSVEIEAAQSLGAEIVHLGKAWVYEKRCNCEMFKWINELYEYRRSVGSATIGYPIKLGLNSLYGKFAQRIGGGSPWSNPIYAGYITANTRAWLARAAASNPDAVCMLATDGIFALEPLSYCETNLGINLGQWDASIYDQLHIVQPGLYWGPPRPKTRGIPRTLFEKHMDRFAAAWNEFVLSNSAYSDDAPIVNVPMQIFIGHRLALARGKPDLAGCWADQTRGISYAWGTKRASVGARVARHIVTKPRAGDAEAWSMSYRRVSDAANMAEDQAREFEAMPDWIELI